MKIKLNLQKSIIVYITLFGFLISTNNANAQFAVLDPANLGQNVTQVINQVKDAIKTAQQVKNTYDTVKNTAQSLKNFDLTQAASAASGAALSQIGDIVTKNLSTYKGASTNVFTNGQQAIGDLNNYMTKSSTNAIKKSLNDLKSADSNPYQSTALKDLVKQARNKADGAVNNLKVVSLAAVAQKEICSTTKLKDVIKNGEPSTWINPKPALKNVDIDELCNANLTKKEVVSNENDEFGISKWNLPLKKGMDSENVKKLKEFLSLKGYLKSQSNGNTFDSSTQDAVKSFQKDQGLDQTGEVDDMTQVAMISVEGQKKEITGKSAQAAWISIANAGYGGPLTRAALSDPSNSPTGIQAAMQAEINKQVSDAQFAATNKYNANGGVIGNEKCLDKEGNEKKIDPTDPTSAYCDNISASGSDSAAKIKADLEAARQSPYMSILSTAQNTEQKSTACDEKDYACKISGTAGKIGKYASILNTILELGNTGNSNKNNSQYSELSKSIESLVSSDKTSQSIAKESKESKQDYALSSGPASQLNDTLDTYKEMHNLNVEKLNNMVYTYFFLQKAGTSGTNSIISSSIGTMVNNLNLSSFGVMGAINSIFGGNKKKKQEVANTANKIIASRNLALLARTLQKNIQMTIDEMVANNTKVVQITAAQKQLKDSNTTNISSVLISNILKKTISQKDVENKNINYQYVDEYQDTESMNPESSIFMIPTKSEMNINTQATKNNLLQIRVRAYKLAKSTNVSSLGEYTPNIPPNFKYTIDADLSRTYKKTDFCKKIENNICGQTIGVPTGNDSLVGELETICKDVSKSVTDYCASSSADQSVCSDQELLKTDTASMCSTMGY